MKSTNKYFAFISYKRVDEEWAIWFQHEMENYHLPVTLNGRKDLPDKFRPVFRDTDELKAGNLPEQLYNALASSTFLIVICSPKSAKSKWVNKEITDFIEIGKRKGIDNIKNIFPFIVDGIPYAKNNVEECFPEVLRNLPATQERVGGSVNENGRDKAFVRVLAGMLPNVDFDELWNRYERDKAEEQRIERERKDHLLKLQSRFVAEKTMRIAEEDSYLARILAVEVLPKDLGNPDRPYTLEAELALRKAVQYNNAIFRGHTGSVISISFSPDGKRVVSGSVDNTLRVWELETGRQICPPLVGHENSVHSVAFGRDGDRIVSLANDFTARVWNAETGEIIGQTIERDIRLGDSAAFAPDDNHVVTIDPAGVRFWEVGSGLSKATVEFSEYSEVPHAWTDGKRMWIIASEKGTTSCLVRVYDLEDSSIGVPIKFSVPYYKISEISLSPDSKKLAIVMEEDFLSIWNVETGEQIGSQIRHTSRILSAAFSPDGKRIVSGLADRTVRIWDVETGEQIGDPLIGHTDIVVTTAFSLDGKRIVSGSADGTLRVWEIMKENDILESCEIPDEIKKAIEPIRQSEEKFWDEMVFWTTISADGNRAMSFCWDGIIRFWDTATGVQVGHEFEADGDFSVFEDAVLAFSSDGKRTAFGTHDGILYIHDVTTGRKIVAPTNEHKIGIVAIAFSPSADRIVSAYSDGSLRIWDAETGNQLFDPVERPANDIIAVAFSLDSQHVFSVYRDGTTRSWNFPSLQNLINQTRERFKKRHLTYEERERYYL